MTGRTIVIICCMIRIIPEAVYMEDKGTHIALAEHVGGTYENFIRMMNDKVKEIGCQNTNFTNPHGLPDESHVTSAYDMALIKNAALQ